MKLLANIYIVSGHPRTGTSMMMQVGEAGGLEVYKSPERDAWAVRFGDEQYTPNPHGLYELSKELRRAFLTNPQPHEGKLVKILHEDVIMLSAGSYRIAFMERDYEEVCQSFLAFFGRRLGGTEHGYHRAMDYAKGILRQRRDVELTVLQYRDVVADPNKALAELGWPIDVEAAAAVVDPEQVRYKAEHLTKGVLLPGERVA